jgi:hypothetical protein
MLFWFKIAYLICKIAYLIRELRTFKHAIVDHLFLLYKFELSDFYV